MSKIFKAFSVVIAFAALNGCATLKLQKGALAQTKSVAIIGFSGSVELTDDKGEPSTNIGGMVDGIKNAQDVLGGDYDKRRMDQGAQIYADLAQHLSQATGWTVVDPATLVTHPEYRQYLDQNPNDKLGKIGLQRLPTVLCAEPAEQLKPAQRAELVHALGVDAVAIAKVTYLVGSKSGLAIGGIGQMTTFPKAVVRFAVYDGHSADPIWSDVWAEGPTNSQGFANTMGVHSNENETAILESTANDALAVLIKRYQAQR